MSEKVWVRVVRNGRVTIPKSLRERLGIKQGDLVHIQVVEVIHTEGVEEK